MRPLLIAVLILIVCRHLVAASKPTAVRYEFTEPQMGVPFKIVVYAPSDEVANRAVAAAHAVEMEAALCAVAPDTARIGVLQDGPAGRLTVA